MGNVDSDPRNNGEFNKNRENGRKPSLDNQNMSKRKQQLPDEANVLPKDKGQQIKKQEPVVKLSKPCNTSSGFGRPQETSVRPNKPLNADSGPGRPPKPGVVHKVNNETKFLQKSDRPAIQRKPVVGQQDVSTRSTLFFCHFSFLVFSHVASDSYLLLNYRSLRLQRKIQSK